MTFPYNGFGGRETALPSPLLHGISQDTAMPFPYNDLRVGTRHCRLLRDTNQDTAMPFPYLKTINRAIVTSIARLIVGNSQQLTVNC